MLISRSGYSPLPTENSSLPIEHSSIQIDSVVTETQGKAGKKAEEMFKENKIFSTVLSYLSSNNANKLIVMNQACHAQELKLISDSKQELNAELKQFADLLNQFLPRQSVNLLQQAGISEIENHLTILNAPNLVALEAAAHKLRENLLKALVNLSEREIDELAIKFQNRPKPKFFNDFFSLLQEHKRNTTNRNTVNNIANSRFSNSRNSGSGNSFTDNCDCSTWSFYRVNYSCDDRGDSCVNCGNPCDGIGDCFRNCENPCEGIGDSCGDCRDPFSDCGDSCGDCGDPCSGCGD